MTAGCKSCMTPEEKIEDIRARLAQASEGPWYVGRCDQGDATCPVMRDGRVVAEVSTWTARGFIDATFIAEARQDIPFLLAELDAAKALYNELEAWRVRMGYNVY